LRSFGCGDGGVLEESSFAVAATRSVVSRKAGVTLKQSEQTFGEKLAIKAFWDEAACGEALYLQGLDRSDYEAHAEHRYRLEPYIPVFGRFDESRDLRVLEIGVGLGADHQRFAAAGAILTGIDLTERAVEHTQRRLSLFGLTSELSTGDAEQLSFADNTFDVVYSWGVIRHSPDTPKAVREIFRVLKPGGNARIMVYHKWSLVGVMLWLRYVLAVGRPFRSLGDIYASHLESPGTKAYSIPEARQLFQDFSDVNISTVLTRGDLLQGAAGQRHQGSILFIARRLWPRSLLKRLFPSAGLFMLIQARKAHA
jgi:SAM-dependent methyltransferase